MRLLAILHVVLFVVVLCCPLVAAQDETLAVGGLKTIRIERNVSAYRQWLHRVSQPANAGTGGRLGRQSACAHEHYMPGLSRGRPGGF